MGSGKGVDGRREARWVLLEEGRGWLAEGERANREGRRKWTHTNTLGGVEHQRVRYDT